MMVLDGVRHLWFGDDGENLYFCWQKEYTMTQKEAIIEALKRLGGKANLNDIYRFAYVVPLSVAGGSLFPIKRKWQS